MKKRTEVTLKSCMMVKRDDDNATKDETNPNLKSRAEPKPKPRPKPKVPGC